MMSEVSPFPGGASWNVDTLKAYIDAHLCERMRAGDAATAAQQKAVDAAFSAQEKAVETAFSAQEKAVDAALIAQEKAVSAALAAQKEAVNKSEHASDKRFASVNEFRAQLNDQAKTFATRSDLDNIKEQLNEVKLTISRSDSKGIGSGATTDRLIQIIPIFISLLAIMIAIWSSRI